MDYYPDYDDEAQASDDDVNFTFEALDHITKAGHGRSTLLIWRVEDPIGRGFYRDANRPEVPSSDDGLQPNPYHILGERVARKLEAHPVPCSKGSEAAFWGDPGDGLCGAWKMGRSWSGFNSLSQARRWFSGRTWTDKLGERGWLLVAYRRADLEALVLGGHQVVFDPPKAGTPCARLNLRLLHALSTAEVVALALEAFQ